MRTTITVQHEIGQCGTGAALSPEVQQACPSQPFKVLPAPANLLEQAGSQPPALCHAAAWAMSVLRRSIGAPNLTTDWATRLSLNSQ